MPIYEYRCNQCGHQLEAIQKLADAPLTLCPQCGASALRKQVSAPAFRLSGSGWYETDFKSDKEQRRNLAQADKGGQDQARTKSVDSPATPDKPKADKAPVSAPSKAD